MEENCPLDTGDEQERDDDEPVLRKQSDGAQHEQGGSGPNLCRRMHLSVCFVLLVLFSVSSLLLRDITARLSGTRVGGRGRVGAACSAQSHRGRSGREGRESRERTCTY